MQTGDPDLSAFAENFMLRVNVNTVGQNLSAKAQTLGWGGVPTIYMCGWDLFAAVETCGR